MFPRRAQGTGAWNNVPTAIILCLAWGALQRGNIFLICGRDATPFLLLACAALTALNSVIDFSLTWSFYFPQFAKTYAQLEDSSQNTVSVPVRRPISPDANFIGTIGYPLYSSEFWRIVLAYGKYNRACAWSDYPSTFQEVDEWFRTDAACRGYIRRLRWPGGFMCPFFGWTGEPWETSRGLLHCRGCQGQTSLSAGTIFQDHWSKGDTLFGT
jgi:hypothetical protein